MNHLNCFSYNIGKLENSFFSITIWYYKDTVIDRMLNQVFFVVNIESVYENI